MKYKVMYTAGAKKDLRNVFRYISEDRKCCRTDRADYDRNSEAGYYAEQKPAL